MATYIFYPRRADGSALTFETHECVDDAEALAKAESVLREHDSAIQVGVWNGERKVGHVPHAVASLFEEPIAGRPSV